MAIFAAALTVQAGLAIADIINVETDGEAYFPSIKENKEKLKLLSETIETARQKYLSDYDNLSANRGKVESIISKNVIIIEQFKQVATIVDKVAESLKSMPDLHVSGSFPQLPQSGMVQVILNAGSYSVNFLGIAGYALKLIRGANSTQAQLKSLTNHVSNVLKGTKLTTNTLRTAKIGKLQGTMVVAGLAFAAVNFGLNIAEAEKKADRYKEFVSEATQTAKELHQQIDTIASQSSEINEVYKTCRDDLKNLLVDGKLDYEDGRLVAELSRLDPENKDQFLAFQEKIIQEMNDLIKDIRKVQAKVQLTNVLKNLIPSYTSGLIQLETLLAVGKGVSVDFSDEDIKGVIRDLGGTV